MKPPILEAYFKGIDIIKSCQNQHQCETAWNYIDNFRKLYGYDEYYYKLLNRWKYGKIC